MQTTMPLNPKSDEESNSVVDIVTAAPVKLTYSEKQLDDQTFIRIPHASTELVETISANSSLHSLTREATNADAMSDDSDISDIFESEENISIPLADPKRRRDFEDCLDTSPVVNFIVENEEAVDRKIMNFADIQRVAALQEFDTKAGLLEDIFERAQARIRFVDDNLPRLEQLLRRDEKRAAGEKKCPYKKLLNEYGRKGEYSPEAFVMLKKKT